jgi:phosphatidate cytidylyltransferase
MLKQRVLTALVLLALWLPTLWLHSPWPFIALTLLLVSAAAWEWARLNGYGPNGAWACGALFAVACAMAIALAHAAPDAPALWWLAACLWIAGGATVLRNGPARWPALPRELRIVIGLAALGVEGWSVESDLGDRFDSLV